MKILPVRCNEVAVPQVPTVAAARIMCGPGVVLDEDIPLRTIRLHQHEIDGKPIFVAYDTELDTLFIQL